MTAGVPVHDCDPDHLWALAVGVLEPEESGEHLTGCATCRAQLGEIRADVEALGAYSGPDPGAGGSADELAAAILARWRRVQARGRLLRWGALGVVLVGALVGGLVSAHGLMERALVRQGLWRLEHAVQRIQDSEGSFPADEAALSAALTRLGDTEIPRDAEGRPLDYHGRPFRYRQPAQKVRGLFDLWSVGADGIDEAGEGDDQTNWSYVK